MKKEKVGVGVGAILYNPADSTFLMGLRKGSHGSGTWALPGGWLEVNETFTECAIRELKEETGIDDTDFELPKVIEISPCNNIFPTVHSVSVFVQIQVKAGFIPQRMEPDKCEKWEWFPIKSRDTWPTNLFPSAKHVLYSNVFSQIV